MASIEAALCRQWRAKLAATPPPEKQSKAEGRGLKVRKQPRMRLLAFDPAISLEAVPWRLTADIDPRSLVFNDMVASFPPKTVEGPRSKVKGPDLESTISNLPSRKVCELRGAKKRPSHGRRSLFLANFRHTSPTPRGGPRQPRPTFYGVTRSDRMPCPLVAQTFRSAAFCLGFVAGLLPGTADLKPQT